MRCLHFSSIWPHLKQFAGCRPYEWCECTVCAHSPPHYIAACSPALIRSKLRWLRIIEVATCKSSGQASADILEHPKALPVCPVRYALSCHMIPKRSFSISLSLSLTLPVMLVQHRLERSVTSFSKSCSFVSALRLSDRCWSIQPAVEFFLFYRVVRLWSL